MLGDPLPSTKSPNPSCVWLRFTRQTDGLYLLVAVPNRG
jgi:hypothetical protein